MIHPVHDVLAAVAQSIDGWRGPDDSIYLDPFLLGAGGEGVTIVAERVRSKRPKRNPATIHVVLKLPIRRDSGRWEITDTQCDRIRAEHEKRLKLGNAPHLSQTPELVMLDTKTTLGKVGLPYKKVDQATLEPVPAPLPEEIPVLLTPLGRYRGGAMVPIALHRVIPEYGCWSSRELLNWTTIVRALGRALWSVHGRGWAHGDIKPENVVLYESRGRWHDVHLIDFGMVYPDLPGALRTGGTQRYFRPERNDFLDHMRSPQGKQKKKQLPAGLSPATEDLFALGLLLLNVLLGREVFQGLSKLAEAEGQPHQAFVRLVRERAAYELKHDAYGLDEHSGRHFTRNEYRVAAFQLCFRLIEAWPDAERSTVDVLRELLAAIDVRLVGVGDPETMFTKLLVGFGATQGGSRLRISRIDYLGLKNEDEGRASAASDPPPDHDSTDDGTNDPSAIDARRWSLERAVDHAVEALRRGRGALAEARLQAVVERASAHPPGAPWMESPNTAYQLCQALRLLCGVLLVREGKVLQALAILEQFRDFGSKWPHDEKKDIARIVEWWVRHLTTRLQFLIELHGPLSAARKGGGGRRKIVLAVEQAPLLEGTHGEDVRARDAADRWQKSLTCDIKISNGDLRASEIAALKKVQDKRESSHEAAYGAIQLMRAYGTIALARVDDFLSSVKARDLARAVEGLGTIAETTRHLWDAVNAFVLSMGWSVAGPMPHEYALALRHAAAILLRLFTMYRELLEELRAVLVNDPSTSGFFGLDRRSPPFFHRFLIPRANLSLDVDAALLGAASAALAAAEAYRDLQVMPPAIAAFTLAGRCYLACSSPEHQLEGLMWLGFARNDLVLFREAGGYPQAQQRDPYQEDIKLEEICRLVAEGTRTWARSAARAYSGIAGEDPGSFIGRIMFNRYGIDLAKLTNEALAVELLHLHGLHGANPATKTDPSVGKPRPGGSLEFALTKVVRHLGARKDLTSLLEYDCGLGSDCKVARDLGFRGFKPEKVTGVDTVGWCIEDAKKRSDPMKVHFERLASDMFPCPGSKLDLTKGSYDVVWMHDALCRMTRRKDLLAQARRALKPDGFLIFTDWIQVRRATQDDWRALCEIAGLVDLETERGYRDLLAAAGFEVCVMRRFDQEMYEFFQAMASEVQRTPSELSSTTALGVIKKLAASVAQGKSGVSGWLEAPFESEDAAMAGDAAPQPGRKEIADDWAKCHKSEFIGWLWVIARPKSGFVEPRVSPRPPAADQHPPADETQPDPTLLQGQRRWEADLPEEEGVEILVHGDDERSGFPSPPHGSSTQVTSSPATGAETVALLGPEEPTLRGSRDDPTDGEPT